MRILNEKSTTKDILIDLRFQVDFNLLNLTDNKTLKTDQTNHSWF